MYKVSVQNIYQQTIKEITNFQGIGLHSGKTSNIRLIPGKDNQGIIFKRTDLKENSIVEANYKNVSSAKLCTTLENTAGVKVSTVEHLLAAFYILGIDNKQCPKILIPNKYFKRAVSLLA